MKPHRFLIFSATFGAGHVKAAEALIVSIKTKEPTAEIIHEDTFELINKQMNNLIRLFYISLIKRAPKVWGKFYNMTKDLDYDSLFNRMNNNYGKSKLMNYINAIKPDVIICTYPTVAGMLASLRLNGELNIPVISVVTDYTVHSQWIHPGVDLNIVGNRDVYKGFVERGIDKNRIQISGIPVNPKFDTPSNKEEIFHKLGLKKDRLTFLIMGGAYGVLNKAKWMVKRLANVKENIQLIIVCGKDKKLYESLDDVITKTRNPVLRFGYVNNIDELMTAADVIITKAGGLTVSEALTKHLPLIIFKPIPGQEENNATFIKKIGAGFIAPTDEQLMMSIEKIIKNPQLITEMMHAAESAFPGQSSKKAAESIIELTKQYPHRLEAREREQESLEEAWLGI